MLPKICSFSECEKPSKAWNLCAGHGTQRYLGKPLAPLKSTPWSADSNDDPEVKFWRRVEKTEGCWNWLASTSNGYGQMTVRGKNLHAHRISFTLANGEIPEGLVIDHICHNTRCVRPSHLRVVTIKENIEHQRGARRDNRGSGIRGVYYDKVGKKWYVQVKHQGKKYLGGRYSNIEEAERVAIALRNELFTNNTADRI